MSVSVTVTNVSTYPVHTQTTVLDDAARQSAQQYDSEMNAFLKASMNPDGSIKSSAIWRPGSFRWVAYDDITDDLNDGWILGDGAIYAVTTFPALAKRFGKRYGGDGTTTFGVPNLSDRVILGYGVGATLGTTTGATGGTVNHTHGHGSLAVASHVHGSSAMTAADHVHSRGAHSHHVSGTTDAVGDHQHSLPTASGVGRSGGADTADSGDTGMAGGHSHTFATNTDSDGNGNTAGSGALAISGNTDGATAGVTGSVDGANQAYIVFKGLIKT